MEVTGRTASMLLFVVLLMTLVATSTLSLCTACYLFPKDIKDPCETKKCPFHSTCVVQMDGMTPECLCPEKCARYGDNRGSQSVCGTDGVDYSLVCELKRAACTQKKDIQVKYRGLCGESFHVILFRCNLYYNDPVFHVIPVINSFWGSQMIKQPWTWWHTNQIGLYRNCRNELLTLVKMYLRPSHKLVCHPGLLTKINVTPI